MHLTFRRKLFAVVAVNALAAIALILASSVIQRQVDRELQEIRQHYVPRIALRPQLERGFDRVVRGLQDAAASSDEDLLAQARADERALLDDIAHAGDAIAPADAAALRGAIEDYFAAAYAISERIVAGESTQDLIAGMEAMQQKQARAAALLEDATRFDEAALGRAFGSAAAAERTGARIRLIVSLVCLFLVLGLSIWIGRDVIRRLGELAAGFRRFGEGHFDAPIPIEAPDELGDVAHQANLMAARLEWIDWLKNGHARVVENLHGDISPEEVGRRATAVIAEHLDAPRASIQYVDTGGRMALLAEHGDVPDAPHMPVHVTLVHAGEIRGELEVLVGDDGAERAGELLESVREGVTTAIEVARARAAAARASRYKSEFLANMSHELRTPLNAIIGFSELLHDGMVPAGAPEHQEFLSHILTSGRHLLQLINDVLDLSKVEAGKLEFHPESLRLTTLVGEVLGILRATATGRGVEVVSHVDDKVDRLVLDPSRLKQVLYNLLSNAIKFTPAGGTVTVRATAESPDQVRIEVEDTGIGIAPEHLDRLFVEFQQVGDESRKQRGTGLGLSLTRRLVEAQGGSVGVRSTLGVGSVFHAVLPRTARRLTTRAPVVTLSPDVPAILIVEDDLEDQARLAAALGEAGYAVEVASSGHQAVARTRERAFHAITLDLILPDMSGLDVLKQIRGDSRNRDVPVIVITVVAEPGAVAGFAVHDVLPKPVDADVLRASLRRANLTRAG